MGKVKNNRGHKLKTNKNSNGKLEKLKTTKENIAEDVEMQEENHSGGNENQLFYEDVNPDMILNNPDEEGIEDNAEEVKLEKQLKFSQKFDVKQFRTKLLGDHFIPELRHFLYEHNSRKRVVEKYLERKGTPFELVVAFKRIDQNDNYQVAYLAEAFRVVLDVTSTQPNTRESSAETCRFFMKNHSDLLTRLLKSRNPEHRKTSIGLMTIISVLAPLTIRTLLNCFNVYKNKTEMNTFLSHKAKGQGITVRETFLRFILSLLVDGTTFVIRVLLDKYELVAVALAGLLYDDCQLVVSVLTAFKKCVLESLLISKTKKIRVFDIHVVGPLLELYQWRGPVYFEAMHASKKRTLDDYVDLQKREVVRHCVNDFLILLLSSRKYGLAFDSMINFRQKKNEIQKKTLSIVKSVWADPLKQELVIRILIACPELAEGMIRHLSINLRDPNDVAFRILAFISDIVTELSPKVLRAGLDQISLTRFTIWMKELCLPVKVIQTVAKKSFIHSPVSGQRTAVARILSILFRQYCNYMKAIIEREKFKGNELKKFRFDMLDYLLVNFPSVKQVLLALFISIQDKSDDLVEHMHYTFDLLINVCKANRSFVDHTLMVANYIEMLYPLFEENEDENATAAKLKGIKLLLMLNPRSLNPSEDRYYTIVQQLCILFARDADNKLNIGSILQKLLINSNVFDNGALEVDIWIESMRYVDKEHIPDIAKCWSILKSAMQLDMSPYHSIDYMSTKHMEELFANILKGLTIEGFMDVPVMSKGLVLVMQNIDEHPNCKTYFGIVAFFLFHFIPAPKAIYELYGKHYSKFYKYMLSWLDEKKPAKLKASLMPCYSEMYASILEGKSDFIETFKGDQLILIDDKELNLHPILQHPRSVLLCIYQICFMTSHLAERKNLELIQANAASHYLIHLLYALKVQDVKDEDDISAFDANPNDEIEIPYLDQALNYIYSRNLPLLQNFNVFGQETSDKNYVKFISTLTEAMTNLHVNDFNKLVANYRSKVVNKIISAISDTLENHTIPQSELITNVLDTFQMLPENCIKLLNNLSQLEVKYYVTDSNNRSIYFDILAFTLNRLATLKKVLHDEHIVVEICSIYVRLLTVVKVDFSLEKLEESLYNFLKISHPCIDLIPKEMFLVSFENNRMTKSTVKLASLLLERKDDFKNEFLSLLPTHMTKKELVYPLLNVLIVSKVNIPPDILNSAYKEYKTGIIKAIEKPQKAAVIYKENVKASIHLIETCMPTQDFYKKSLKTDSVEIFQLQMIEAIFQKEMKLHTNNPDVQSVIFVNFINNFIQFFLVVTKRDPVDVMKISSICWSFFSWIQSFENMKIDFDATTIIDTQHWQSFCKTCLKLGMRAIEESDEQIAGSNDTNNSLFLKLLAYLFDKLYESDSDHNHAAMFFEMITSHSRFLDIVLLKNPTMVKTHLMHCIVVLTQKNRSFMEEKHVALWLGAYQAKLSICDRYTLAILQRYEESGINCSKYKPFIWGESAIDQYSLKTLDDKPIIQHDLSLAQLIALFDRNTSDFTLKNFPVWRNLDALSQLPAVEFENPYMVWKGYGRTELERKIEIGDLEFDQSSLKLLPVSQKVYDDCYDPAFIIPLLVSSLAPGNYLHPVKPVQNGLLGIAFAALSSLDTNMRLAAGLAHLRYRDHFESNKFLDKPLWNQAYENIRTGLVELQNRWSKHKKGVVPRAPFVSGLFLAVSMTTLVDPLDPMYKSLSMYLRVRSTYDFLCVPEFNVLFNSPEVDHQTHRQFIVNIMCNGVKCSSDLFLLATTGALKVLMGFYNFITSTLDINLRILSVFNNSFKIPGTIGMLIEHIGILPWLHGVILSTDFFHFETIEAILNIMSNLWYSIKATHQSSELVYLELRIYRMMLRMVTLISSRLSLKSFTQFVNILSKTANDNHRSLSEESLDKIISYAQRYYADHIWYVENVKEFGVKCIESSESYCKRLIDSNLDDMRILGLLSLRNFVVRWKELEK